jgi:hypothetical protein
MTEYPKFHPLKPSHLSVVDEVTCQALRAAACTLVRRKQLLDDLCEGVLEQWLVPDSLAANRGTALDSFSFLSIVLPFWDLTPYQHEFPARIPVDLTLGDSSGWKMHQVDPSERARLYASLRSDDRAFRDEKDVATAIWIRPLGLFVMDEGKSRVRFLRSMGETAMPAAVTPVDYPAAERLTMHVIQVAGRELAWLVLDNQHLVELRCPAISMPLLRAYGVCTSHQWPSSWPAPMAVLGDMDQASVHATRPRQIDLLALQQRQMEEAKIYRVSLAKVSGSRLRLPPALTALGTWMGMSTGLILWADTPFWTGFAVATVAALASGVVLYWAPLLKAPCRHIRTAPLDPIEQCDRGY